MMLFLLTMAGCDKEEIIDLTEKNQQIGSPIKNLTLDEALKDIEFSQISNALNLTRQNQRDIYNEVYLDTKKILKIVKKEYTTYTFLVVNKKQENKNSFTNLIVEKSPKKTRGYLAHYIPTNEYLIKKAKGIETPFHGSVSFSPFTEDLTALLNTLNKKINNTSKNNLQSRTSDCYYQTLTIETSCASRQHWPGENCELTGSSRASTRYVDALICDESGGGGSGIIYEFPTIYISENETIGIGGDGTGYITPSGSTHPNLPTEITDISADLAGLNTSDQIDYLLGGNILSDNQITWLSSNPTEADKILLFLLENNTTEAKEFAKLAIDTYMDNCEFDLNSYNYFIQQIPDYKARMTQLELQIYNAQPLAIQYRYLYNANEASNKAKELFPESSLYNFHNDKSDAFRHAYFHGLNTYYIGYDLSVLLGDAHEMETPNNLILEKVMDLFNNQKGREIAQNPSISMNGYGVIRLRIYNAILNGQLMHLFPLNIGGTINLNTQLIPTNKP